MHGFFNSTLRFSRVVVRLIACPQFISTAEAHLNLGKEIGVHLVSVYWTHLLRWFSVLVASVVAVCS